MTKQKAAVLAAVRSSIAHLTAQEIYEQVKNDLPDTVLATVYNNLNALEADGLIRRLHFDGDADRFDKSPVPHAHFVCPKCGKITDAPCEEIIPLLENAYKVNVESYELTIQALCDGCK